MNELIVRTEYGSDCVYFEGDVLPDGVLPNFTGGPAILNGQEVNLRVRADRSFYEVLEVPV